MTAAIGLNLVVAGAFGTCPMVCILRKAGVREMPLPSCSNS